METLIASGCRGEQRPGDIVPLQDNNGRSCLHNLLDANTNIEDKTLAELQKVIKLLVECKISATECQDRYGETPLILAVKKKYPLVIVQVRRMLSNE
jgi:hypothetical protein